MRRRDLVASMLLVLCATARAANDADKPPPPAPLSLRLTDGARPIGLEVPVHLSIETQSGPDGAVRATALTPTWRTGADGQLRASVEDPTTGLRARLRSRLLPDGAAEIVADVTYTRATWVGLVGLDLALGGPLTVVNRHLETKGVSSVAYLDRLAVKHLVAGEVHVLVDDGPDGVVAHREGDRNQIRVELFSTAARPFRYQALCREDWRQGNHEVALRVRLRDAGERDYARIELRARDVDIVARGRFPEGRAAALVVTDHADQSSPETFTALARGRSDSLAPVAGLEGHHLLITKSLFFRGEFNGEGRRQLEDERVSAVAEEMARAGSEIIPHSVTPNADDRDQTALGLARFDDFHATTWIDHQPGTNCEAFTNQGWRGPADRFAARWRIADLLSAHGYHYIWAGFDEPLLDLLGDERLERRPLSLWPLGRLAPGDPNDRWLFATTWMLLEQNAFYRTLGPERLDQLEHEHGLAILHTYLESLHFGEDNPRFANRNVLRRVNGVVETDPRLEKVFEDLEHRVLRGSLWMPTLAALGDHLRAVERVRVRSVGNGAALVMAPTAVRGLTLLARGEVDVRIDGKAPRGVRYERGATWFWFDLPAARPVRVSLTPDSAPYGPQMPAVGSAAAQLRAAKTPPRQLAR